MKRLRSTLLSLLVLAILLIAGCGGGGDEAADADTETERGTPTTRATASPLPEEPTPDILDELISPDALPDQVFATGYIEAAQDADLVFQVNGEVGEVLVEEGDKVQEDELLAILDTRRFDQEVRNAEAALISARADEMSLVEDPQPERVRAAEAAVAQAAGNLQQVQGSVTAADIAAAQATLDEAREALADLEAGADPLDVAEVREQVNQARISLQNTRDQLSHAKTQAEIQLQQATEQLQTAQINYSDAYWDWRYVRDNGKAPPQTEGRNRNPPLSAHSEQDYRDRLNQAENSLRQAEDSLQAAQKSLEQARLNEVTGIQQAEAQLQTAQIRLEQVNEPPENDQLAAARARVANAEANLSKLQGEQRAGQVNAAQAGLSSAQANLDQLYSDPTESQSIRAEANIERAQANLEQTRLNREYAEIRAPFAGEVAVVNIDPGDPGTTGGMGGEPAIRLVDLSELRVEVDVSDADIAKLAVGQRAEVVPDALPDRTFEGLVSFISPTADTSPQGVTTYRVRIVLDKDGETLPLRAGMSVSVVIYPGTADNTTDDDGDEDAADEPDATETAAPDAESSDDATDGDAAAPDDTETTESDDN